MTRLTRETQARANIELGDVTHHNLKQLKKINTVVLPVSYNDKFYLDVLESGELAKLAYYNDVVVGAVCSRIDTSENMRRLYIMTLGCLYPYRRLGIGTVMVQHILNCVERDGNFDSIFLHVKVDNKGAIEFYKRFGFEIVETKQHYYKRIEPADAHVLQKTLTKKAAVAAAAANSNPSHHHHHSSEAEEHHRQHEVGNGESHETPADGAAARDAAANANVNNNHSSIQNSTTQQTPQAAEKNR
ncbi:probable N-acetyltransferase san [Anopheles stephensi]|uniref:probable N-acetyltransferase san n=1 Tax=Anopheles stephensi TaxID=30069 RepID=UPI0007D647D5|nr:probable N-acetyltransferase san [Anopheles stephensi]